MKRPAQPYAAAITPGNEEAPRLVEVGGQRPRLANRSASNILAAVGPVLVVAGLVLAFAVIGSGVAWPMVVGGILIVLGMWADRVASDRRSRS